jgi:hypothetical protein
MIGHQAPGQNIGIWHNINLDFLKKKQVILPVEKYFLLVIALVVNMI